MKQLTLLVSLVLFCLSCQNSAPEAQKAIEPTVLTGKTMGTTYNIRYLDNDARNFQPSIDSVLIHLDFELSTYNPKSVISAFNKLDTFVDLTSLNHFRINYLASQEIYKASSGAFDPTIMPIVNYWGFGYTGKKEVSQVDSSKIDSMIVWVGYDKLKYDASTQKLSKSFPHTELDFNAIAKGYGVDLVGWWLEAKGIKSYMVEIGGEVRSRGKKSDGTLWTIGINTPKEDAPTTDFQTLLSLENVSVATSGNYRNFYKNGSATYSHTINPATGFPERSNLLSASIITEDCMYADGYATACMCLGLEKAWTLVQNNPKLKAYFVYANPDGSLGTRYSPELEKYLIK